MNESKLDLIAKLLAKAEKTTPEEAEALTEHAERLMVKYGIEQARIDERRGLLGETREQIVEERMLFTGAYARDLREIGSRVAFALDTVRPLLAEQPGGGGSILYLVGFSSDAKQAQVLTASLQVQAMVAMRAWWLAVRHDYRWHTESEKRRARSGFIRGFGAGAAERLASSRRQIIDEEGPGTEIVLVSRRDRVDSAVNALATTKARRRQGADAVAFVTGQIAGRDSKTVGTALGGGIKQSAGIRTN